MRSPIRYSLAFLSLLTLDGCWKPYPPTPALDSDTYRPIYASAATVRTIQTLGPQPYRKVGKIYVKDQYLLINDIGTGIHVVDNRDPANPVQLSFISIPGNQEMAVRDSLLYADNTTDLVTISLTNPRQPRLVNRLASVFPQQNFPDLTNIRFACPDPSQGVVVGWEKAPVDNPQCFR